MAQIDATPLAHAERRSKRSESFPDLSEAVGRKFYGRAFRREGEPHQEHALMDIKEVAAAVAKDEEGVDLTIDGKDGESYKGASGSPATITVVGSESKKLQQVRDAQFRRLVKRGSSKFKPEELRANRIELAAAAVTAWEGWEANGAPWPCTSENVKALLAQADHILTQVEEGISRHADFFGQSSPS